MLLRIELFETFTGISGVFDENLSRGVLKLMGFICTFNEFVLEFVTGRSVLELLLSFESFCAMFVDFYILFLINSLSIAF